MLTNLHYICVMHIKVGIIEGDKELASLIKEKLTESEGFYCESVFNRIDEALHLIPSLDLDVVLTDIYLEGKSVIECLAVLTKNCLKTQFLVFTSCEDSESVFSSFHAGVAGYLVKPIQTSALLDAITEVYHGGAPMSSQIARKVVQSFYNTSPSPLLTQLTTRESEIMNCIAEGYRYKEIGEKLFISTTTVRKHIYNIYKKLQVHSKLQAINKVFKH